MKRKHAVDRDIALIGMLAPEGTEKNIFGALRIPPFAERRVSDGRETWHLMLNKEHPKQARGYFTPGYQDLIDNWVLYHFDEKLEPTTWMSNTPMELESQAHHLAAAHGKVLIGGLGMGVLAWNIAQKTSVNRVVVVERNASVIALTNSIARDQQWANWHRVEIVQADLFDFASEPQEKFDAALIDIWPSVGDEKLRPDLQRIANELDADEFAAWGMEMDFVSWLSEQKIYPRNLRAYHWKEYSRSIGVPLIMRSEPRMAALAMQAVINGMKHEADKLFGNA